METILQYVQRRINEDADVYVNLEKKSMRIGKKWELMMNAAGRQEIWMNCILH